MASTPEPDIGGSTSMIMNLNLARMLSTGDLADFEIVCGGRTIKVHKNILCAASPFFDRAIRGGMKVR